MTWNPNATVNVSGVNYTSKALVGAAITYGRTTTDQQPRAGYATISLADTTNTDVAFQIGDTVSVSMKNTSGVDVTVFTGTLSDVTATVVDGNNVLGTYVRRDLIAVGPLARLNRRFAGTSGYAAQKDGTRVATIIDENYASTWDGVTPTTLTWATTGATLTWNTYDPMIGTIDTPGLYDLAAYSSGTASAYDLATTAANSGLGVLYDTAGGRINYDDADHRQTNALANGYWSIPATAVLAKNLTQSTRLGDIANTVTYAYDGGSVTATDADSITAYGIYTKQVSTVLANAVDAAAQADRYLNLVAFPTPQFDTLALAIHQPNLDAATINTALSVYNGQPITVSDLPNAVGPLFTGFIEGWTWRIGQTTADLRLTVSDFGRSVVTTQWQYATPTLTWATTTPTTTWNGAIVI